MQPSEERRNGQRYPYPAHVEVGSHRCVGCDISRSGLAVYTSTPLSVGHIVTVNLTRAPLEVGDVGDRKAKVLRSEAIPVGFRVALEFVQSS